MPGQLSLQAPVAGSVQLGVPGVAQASMPNAMPGGMTPYPGVDPAAALPAIQTMPAAGLAVSMPPAAPCGMPAAAASAVSGLPGVAPAASLGGVQSFQDTMPVAPVFAAPAAIRGGAAGVPVVPYGIRAGPY